MNFPISSDDAARWLTSRLNGKLPTSIIGDVPWRTPSALTRPAAVLIPLVWHAESPSVLLTKRTMGLRHHAGQISFPGGKIDLSDGGAVNAALREAEEEVGIARERVRVLGRLPHYTTITDYRVEPVVGMIVPPYQTILQPSEVALVFEVPLDLVLNTNNYARHTYEKEGVQGSYLALDYQDHHIWGATAAILYIFAAALSGVGT